MTARATRDFRRFLMTSLNIFIHSVYRRNNCLEHQNYLLQILTGLKNYDFLTFTFSVIGKDFLLNGPMAPSSKFQWAIQKINGYSLHASFIEKSVFSSSSNSLCFFERQVCFSLLSVKLHNRCQYWIVTSHSVLYKAVCCYHHTYTQKTVKLWWIFIKTCWQ